MVVGAVVMVVGSICGPFDIFLVEFKGEKDKQTNRPTDGRTNGPTDGPTDIPSYREA